MAARLSIGTETVNYHLKQIYQKLNVRSRTEAVIKYLGCRPRSRRMTSRERP
jgi:DNA-binding CsgD family transcriptional regulator